MQNLPTIERSWRPLLRTVLFILVIMVTATLGVGAGVFTISRMKSDTSEISDAPTVVATPSIFKTSMQVSIPLPSSREAFLRTAAEKVGSAGQGITQFYLVHGEQENGSPASASEILSVLRFQAPGSFQRSLGESIVFGSVKTQISEPFIILRSSTFDVAFAGMLAWESSMSEDLSPLFGELVRTTVIPLSKDTSPGPARFTDALRENRSIRILYDGTGKERIIYAFVNRSTIIITTSTNALAEILKNLK